MVPAKSIYRNTLTNLTDTFMSHPPTNFRRRRLQDIFMTLQDLARRTEAVGAILSCGLGPGSRGSRIRKWMFISTLEV